MTPDDQLSGVSPIMPAQLEAELDSRNPGHIDPGIADLYVEWGYRFGIRADLAFAQMVHETNFLRYGGDCEAWQNNFAGIGVTGGSPGNVFATPELGVIGQYAHLAWYNFPTDVNPYCNINYDPRHFGPGHANSAHTPRELGGRWAVPGTGYGDAIARYANQIWSYPARGYYLGSFNELAATPATALSTVFYFPWYDNAATSGISGDWIMLANSSSSDARVLILIGGRQMHDPAHPDNDFFIIPGGGEIFPSFPGVTGGPVQVISVTGQKLATSQRVVFRDTLNEVAGVPVEAVSTSGYFPWYDLLSADSMAGDWIIISNLSIFPADVEIWIGNQRVASFSGTNGNAVAPGGTITPEFPNTIGGPVRVVSTNGQQIVASQRVLFRNGFSEMMGASPASLAPDAYFTWYDSRPEDNMRGDWLLISNQGSQSADVDVYAGDRLLASFSGATGNAIAPGGIVTPAFGGLASGPIHVHSRNGQSLLTSQRVLYRDGFKEVPAMSPAGLDNDQWLGWYDSTLFDYMRYDWVMVSNPGAAPARVEIDIGGRKMSDPASPGNDFFTVPAGGSIAPNFDNIVGGPVHVIGLDGEQLLVSQRVVYKEGLARSG